ncbi:Golgi CORVET complex core vacuolar protein 8-domain-containing protein [Mortierella sp. GBAus27b]|nr:Golgi CORVET complex core vacuolar protein 8-domain-containing protein [Mortierella sp. GBAus27b]
MSTLRSKLPPISTEEEYEALLKEILESDSSDDDPARLPIYPAGTQPSSLAFDLDLDLDLDFDPTFLNKTASTHTESFSNSSTPRNSTYGQFAKTAPVSIVIGSEDSSPASSLNGPSDRIPSLLSARDRSQSILSLSTPSSIASSPSSSVNTFTRTSSVTTSSFKSGASPPNNPAASDSFLDHPASPPNNKPRLKSRDKGLADSVARRLEDHQQSFILRQGQRFGRYSSRTESSKGFIRMDASNHRSRSQMRGNASQREGRDTSTTRTTAPIVLKGSNTRLVNGLQSITSLEQKFNELRIPELELLNTPETTIRAVLADIYKISEELHMHLQGGPLADSHQARKMGDDVIISGETQRQKRIKEILDRIVRETSLYEEFVHKSTYLSLDAILNEHSDEDEQELQGLANIGEEPSEIDSASDILHEDTLSQTSLMSGNQYAHVGGSSFPSSPISAMSLRSADPMHQRLRPRAFSHGGPGSVASSSAFTGRHSHNSSVSYSVSGLHQSDSQSQGPGAGAEPWETFRWTPLLKLSDHLFSEDIRASTGLGTCIAVSNIIAVGTSRGSILVYSPIQALIGIFGNPQYALEHGSVCSIAISSDNTHMVAGHSLGSIIVWNISKPNTPSRIIPPINKETAISGRKLGHIRGSAVLHVGFVGIKSAEVVSADDQGMAFHHLLYKVMMVNAVETTRLLGKYPSPKYSRSFDVREAAGASRQSTIFGMGVLPYGQIPHPADSAGLIALLTPFKMLIVCIKPQPQTLFKFLRPKDVQNRDGESSAVVSGNLAWFPATKGHRGSETNPTLAFSWNRHLFIFQIVKSSGQAPSTTATLLSPDRKTAPDANGKTPKLDFVKVGDWICRDGIVGIQWIRPQILLLLTNTEDIIVFDPKQMCETERCSARTLQIVYHDWFKDVAKTRRPPVGTTMTDMKQPVGDMCYNNSWRTHKGKLFVLGVRRLQVGTILNWTDRILALVKSGDFLEGIALATLFYTGKSIQAAVVGLPEDEESRKQIVGEKIYELLTASLNYTFNPERMLDVDADAAAGGVGAGTVLFHDLAIQAIESCLAIEDQGFLFEDVYERYAEASVLVRGIFLRCLEVYILQDRLTEMPPQVMQAFVKHYSDRGMFKELELCICHTPCHVLEMHQIVDLCQRHKLYTGLIYVWNKTIGDYVSPVIELLKVIKTILKDRHRQEGDNDASPSQDRPHTGLEPSLLSILDEKGQPQEEMSNEEIVQKLYSYLADSLLGKSYIDGTKLEDNEAIAAKVSLYSFIFSGRCVMWPPVGGQLILTGDINDVEDLEPTYPYLRLLLRHDSEEFLRVMDLAFEDSYLSSTNRDFSQVSRNGQEGPGRVMSRQLIINTLLEILTPSTAALVSSSFSDTAAEEEYTTKDIAHLYSFIARNYAKSPKSLALPPTTLHRILTRLSSDTDPSTREERQVAVQALLRCYSPGDEEGMMKLYEQAGFYRVLEKLYRSQKQYGPMVVTYLKDPERRSQVFDSIRKLLNQTRPQRSAITEKQRTDIVKTAMEHITEIVDIDGEQAALLVHKYLNAEHRLVLETLNGSKPRLFAYLRGLLEPSSTQIMDQQGDASQDMVTIDGDIIGASAITDPEIHEQYIELLCQYDPSGVYDYLERHQDNSYRLEKVLKLCENAGVVDAVVWILERSGNVGGALSKVLEIVQERIDVLSGLVKSKRDRAIQDVYWSMEEQSNVRASLVRLRGVLNVGKQLCERRSQKVKILSQTAKAPLQQNAAAQNDTETLWFRLLQDFVAASRKMALLVGSKRQAEDKTEDQDQASSSLLNNALLIENAPPALFSNSSPESRHSYHVVDQLVSNFKGFVQSILGTLLLSTSTPQVSLPSLLRRLLKAESEEGEMNQFSDFKDIIMGMLDTFKYEGQLLEMTNGLFERDLFLGVELIAKSRSKGWRPRKGNCEICGGAFWGPNIVRDLWVQQQKAAASAIKAALETSVNSENSGQTSRTDSPSSGMEVASANEPVKTDKERAPSNKDLLIFRCGHGYHRHCLEMETAPGVLTKAIGNTSTELQQSSTPDSVENARRGLSCAVCSGLIKTTRHKPSSRTSSRPGSRSDSSHRHHQRHTMGNGRAGHRQKSIKAGWVTIESPQPRPPPPTSSRAGSAAILPPSPMPPNTPISPSIHYPMPSPPAPIDRHHHHQKSNSTMSNGSVANGLLGQGDAAVSSPGGSRPHTPRIQVRDDRTPSPGPDGYYMSSNEYEAATSPSMKVDNKGKGRALY